eukprot:TRINITY_DN3421_c0_g2_i1.p1 TRINITY_DN3421_c0_g2~~TRINITY_DN3421_c0_g2_i1.p1  ORF type:complete len:609 (+),score=207.24 TRINITY_DN3421_c0_g2_i1:258-1829(+)
MSDLSDVALSEDAVNSPQINITLDSKKEGVLTTTTTSVDDDEEVVGELAEEVVVVVVEEEDEEEEDEFSLEKKAASLIFKQLILDIDIVFRLDSDDIKFADDAGKVRISEATVDNLLLKLVDDFYDEADFAFIFFTSYDYFITSTDLLNKLIKNFYEVKDMYIVNSNNNNNNNNNNNSDVSHELRPLLDWELKRRLRVVSLLKIWTLHRIDHLSADTTFCESLTKWLTTRSLHCTSHITMINNLQTQFTSSLNNYRKSLKREDSETPDPVFLQAADMFMLTADSDNHSSLGPSVIQLAEHLAVIDQTLFKSIPYSEFLHNNHQKKVKSPHFAAMINQFNRFGYWVQGCIVRHDDINKRKDVLSKVIALATESVNIGNMNTAMGVFTALNSSNISRLKSTFKLLPKKVQKQLEDLSVIMDFRKNYSNYRAHLQQASTTSSVVPYLGLISKDLFAIEENTPTLYKDLINWEKMRTLYSQLMQIKQYQEGSYQFKIDKNIHLFLSNLPVLPEDQIYARSLAIEPPD